MKYHLPDEKKDIQKEIKFLENLIDCPGVIKLIASSVIEEEKVILIALELMDYDMYEYLKEEGGSLSFEEYFPIFQQLIFTLSYLQKRGIQHRDLKSKNLLINNKQKQVKICDFGLAINFEENIDDAFIAGTTRYMAPEVLKIIKENNLERLGTEAGSEKILKPNRISKVSSLENLDSQVLNTLSMVRKIRNITIRLSIEERYNVTYNSNFLADVFSLGLNVLECLGVRINKCNSEKKYLENALKEFKTKVSKSFYSLVKSMLKWEESERKDFIFIEDSLLYNFNTPLTYFIPCGLKEIFLKQKKNVYVSAETFMGLNAEDNSENNDIYFFSRGWKCEEVPQEYQEFLLQICQNNCGASIEEIQNLIAKKLKQPTEKEILLDILNVKGEKDISKLVRSYSMQSELFPLINNTLAKNEIQKEDSVRAFVSKFIEENCKRGEFDYKVVDSYAYRGIKVSSDKKGFIDRSEYLPGMVYCWPAFSSTSKREKGCKEFLSNPQNKNKQTILFRIKLNLKNQRNKLDIESCSIFNREEEILLLPYFCFRVISNGPTYISDKNVCLVEIEELGADDNLILSQPRKKLFQFIWLDKNVNKSENEIYFSILATKYSNDVIKFTEIDKAKKFVEETKILTYVICSGEYGEQFFKEVHQLPQVVKMAVFCYNEHKHKKWATKENYPKILGVFSDFFKLNKLLINPFY